nr:type IV secretion system DNA-binding domain-containing protein [Caballeronia sp. BR00000012568055]
MGGWALASAALGALAGAAALWAAWREAPGMPLPIGSLSEHAGYWAKAAAHRALPLLFKSDALFYRDFWRELPAGQKLGVELRLAVAGLAACAPAALLAKPFLTASDGMLFVRGGVRHEGREALRALRRKFAGENARFPDHDLAPEVPWPSSMWTRHTLIVGGVGAGKSTVIRPLLRAIVEADERLMLFDPKGEFTAGLAKPAIIAPWDARGLAWDVARDLRNILDMRRFAGAMVADSHDPMWSNAARQLLTGLLLHLAATRQADWGWGDLAKLIELPQDAMLSIMKSVHPEAIRAVERASVTTTGVLINLSAFCSPVFDLAQAWGGLPTERRISVIDWARGKASHRQIILQGHGAYGELTRSYVEGMTGVFAAHVNSVEMTDSSTRKIWFVADEFAQAGKLPVRALFEVGRSRGVRCVIACQDFAQIEEVHGEKFTRALLSMCGSLIVGQIAPGDTADQICRALGSREVERPNVSRSRGAGGESNSVSHARDHVPLYVPSELGSRFGPQPKGRGVKLLLFARGEAYELRWPHCALPRSRQPHAPAHWLLRPPPLRLAPANSKATSLAAQIAGLDSQETSLGDPRGSAERATGGGLAR